MEVKGNIRADEELKVTVPASIAITAENDASYANTATVEMDFHTFYRAGLNLDTYTAVNGSVSFNETKADTYKGSVNFKVVLEQSARLVRTIDVGEVANTVTASLYDNGDLVVNGNGVLRSHGGTPTIFPNFLNEYNTGTTTRDTKKIIIESGVSFPNNSSGLFSHFKNITSIEGFDKVDVSNVTVMSQMFGKTNITDLTPLANWDVSNVMRMRQMFAETSIKDTTPLEGWNVQSKVSDLHNFMFPSGVSSYPSWCIADIYSHCTQFCNLGGCGGK